MPSIDGAVSCRRSAARKGRAIARPGSGGADARGMSFGTAGPMGPADVRPGLYGAADWRHGFGPARRGAGLYGACNCRHGFGPARFLRIVCGAWRCGVLGDTVSRARCQGSGSGDWGMGTGSCLASAGEAVDAGASVSGAAFGMTSGKGRPARKHGILVRMPGNSRGTEQRGNRGCRGSGCKGVQEKRCGNAS